MFRFLITLLLVGVPGGLALADPIKKNPGAEYDKISKECADGFVKSLKEGDAENSLKFLALPFRGPDGKKNEDFDRLKKELARKPPPGVVITTGDAVELPKLNEYLKKENIKEFDKDVIEDITTYVGKDGRVVLMKMKQSEDGPVSNRILLIRVKDNKAHIVGISRE